LGGPCVAGVVLAAGSSSRLGRNKLLLELGGESLVRRAVRTTLAAHLGPTIVVLGHEAELVRSELAGLACDVVVNADHARGAGSSLRCGVARASQTRAESLVLTLADMPLVTPAMLQGLVRCSRETGAPLVVSRYGDVQAPPHLFTRRLFTELLASDDENGARAVVRRHSAETRVLEWPAPALKDLDVNDDYDQLRSSFAAH